MYLFKKVDLFVPSCFVKYPIDSQISMHAIWIVHFKSNERSELNSEILGTIIEAELEYSKDGVKI